MTRKLLLRPLLLLQLVLLLPLEMPLLLLHSSSTCLRRRRSLPSLLPSPRQLRLRCEEGRRHLLVVLVVLEVVLLVLVLGHLRRQARTQPGRSPLPRLRARVGQRRLGRVANGGGTQGHGEGGAQGAKG